MRHSRGCAAASSIRFSTPRPTTLPILATPESAFSCCLMCLALASHSWIRFLAATSIFAPATVAVDLGPTLNLLRKPRIGGRASRCGLGGSMSASFSLVVAPIGSSDGLTIIEARSCFLPPAKVWRMLSNDNRRLIRLGLIDPVLACTGCANCDWSSEDVCFVEDREADRLSSLRFL